MLGRTDDLRLRLSASVLLAQWWHTRALFTVRGGGFSGVAVVRTAIATRHQVST